MDRKYSQDSKEDPKKSPKNLDKSFDSQEGEKPNQKFDDKPKFDPSAFEVIVKSLSFQAEDEDIIDFFSKYGEVKSVNIQRRYNGSSKGTCFIKFETKEGLEEAIKNTGVTFMGRQVWINKTKSKEERMKEFGGYNNHHRGGYNNRGYNNRGYDNYGGGYNNRGYNNHRGGGYNGGYNNRGYDNYGGGYNNRGYNNHRGGYGNRDRDHHREEVTQSKIVFVGNLNFQSTKEDLWDYLDKVGKVVEVRIATNYNGRSKGFAHVEFETFEDADAALAINGKEFEGRPLRVNLAKSDNRRRD